MYGDVSAVARQAVIDAPQEKERLFIFYFFRLYLMAAIHFVKNTPNSTFILSRSRIDPDRLHFLLKWFKRQLQC